MFDLWALHLLNGPSQLNPFLMLFGVFIKGLHKKVINNYYVVAIGSLFNLDEIDN